MTKLLLDYSSEDKCGVGFRFQVGPYDRIKPTCCRIRGHKETGHEAIVTGITGHIHLIWDEPSDVCP